MKGKDGGMNCGNHWYLDLVMFILGLGYLLGVDGYGIIRGFTMSDYVPVYGALFLFFAAKMYVMHHSD
ncbi:MAG: hypothetical protein AABX01_03090 [Candidatus Micrarchaeota archaeon]